MNESNLSKRLTLVAEQIPYGSTIADIGSDHAYLPCYALKHQIIKSAIAGEVNDGPFRSAVEQVEKLNLKDKISVRKGNGLQVLSEGEVEVITIAGMGGTLISTILEEGKEKLIGVKRLILQPNVAANQVRVWLVSNDWVLINEEIIEEDGIVYEVLTAVREEETPYTEENQKLELMLGPFLMKKKSPIFIKKWAKEIAAWKKIVEQFEKAKQNRVVIEKKEEIIQKINQVEEILR
ncbi:tRNA (adenine(22)-N(1))-methyltransferase TrmK [Bacillaceae bacterium IKA-2]|nr:tRNA (adenine(22)-N(1))-methyltransferase TrmK [Bacillaceae bacterium IKA-2]